MERRVSIGCGSHDQIVRLVEDLLRQAEDDQEPELHVQGNGTGVPNLALRFTNENDPEWGEPVVDYDESSD